MGWERRERGSYYYTRSTRVDGKVVREYLGNDIFGACAWEWDDMQRRHREERAEMWANRREARAALDSEVDAFDGFVELAFRTALVLGGYHQHKRGEWRKRRVR